MNVSISKDLTKIHETNYFGSLEKVIKELKDFEKSDLGEYAIVIEVKHEEEKKEDISIEAKLIDVMIKENVSMKEAIDILNKNSNYSKKDIYNASLRIKNL